MKKTLIISPYAPPSTSGSGLMIYNLLSFFPKDKLVILTGENNQDPKLQKYRLPVPYYYYGGEVLALKFNTRQETFLERFKRTVKNFWPTKFFAQFLVLLILPWKMFSTGKKAIREQKIEQLLAYSDFGPNLLASYWLHKKTKKPLVLHFYDMYAGNKMSIIFKLLSNWLEPKLFASAKSISVMCEELQEHYEKKYGRSITVVHNSIIFDETVLPSPSRSSNKVFRIVFMGNIYWAQQQAVRNLVQAVEGLSREHQIDLRLYTPHSGKYLAEIGIKQSGRVKFDYCLPDEVGRVMVDADCLFVGLSFNSKYSKLINTSSPGKLGEYLISGRPILIHAPVESFLTKHAYKNGFGLVVGEDSVEKLKQAILQLVTRHKLKDDLVEQAWQTAVKEYQAKVASQKLQAILDT